MDLSAWLLRHTPPRVLVVTVPSGTEARLAVERGVRERGWATALSPAEANMLVVAGASGHALEPFVERIWGLIPAPRTRVDVPAAEDARRELDVAVRALHDAGHQRKQAAGALPAAAGQEPEHGGHAGQHSHDTMSSGHEHHGQHGHDMDGMRLPGNVPMADRADDRDGLKLDQLTVPLGPVLPLWPPGLVVRASLQGDVIQRAAVELIGVGDARRDSFWLRSPHRLTARRFDASAGLLAVAGWTDAAAVARRLRDHVLAGTSRAEIAAPTRKWARQVRRSRTLRWLLAGVGQLPDDPATPAALAGDALARLHRWAGSLAEAAGTGSSPDPADGMPWAVDLLPSLLEGRELSVARLVVASLDLDTDVLTRREAHHG